MCEGCTLHVCPPECPFADGSGEEPRCCRCGRRIRAGEAYCEGHDGEVFCADCVDAAEKDELLRICGSKCAFELADRLGLVCSL